MPHPLKISHFTHHINGGAGIAARRIVDCLTLNPKLEIYSYFYGKGQDPNWEHLKLKEKTAKWHWNRFLLSLAKNLKEQPAEPISFYHFGRETALPQVAQKSDIIHFHWMGEQLFDFKHLRNSWPKGKPLVWTMHDLNPVLACGHYLGKKIDYWAIEQEEKWLNPLGKRLINKSHQEKVDFFKKNDVHLVGTSDWLCNFARSTTLGKLARTITKISYPIPPVPETDLSREEIRKKFRLPISSSIICFGAADVGNPRKGFHHLFDLFKNPVFKDVHWVSFGAGKLDSSLPNVHQLGFLKSQKELAELYYASDVVVMPSEEEAFGQVAAESLLCGTPVVCFAETGISDFVITEETGICVENNTSDALSQAILQILKGGYIWTKKEAVRNSFLKKWGKKYSSDKVCESYLDLYEKIT